MLMEGPFSQFYRYVKGLLNILQLMGKFVNTDVQIQEVSERLVPTLLAVCKYSFKMFFSLKKLRECIA